jgi:RecJ-like exonuclease
MKVISFEKWKAKKLEIVGAHWKQLCDTCKGEGDIECDMSHMHDCPHCEGKGYVDIRDAFNAEMYQREVFVDCMLLAAWTNSVDAWPEFEILQSLAPFCFISGRDKGKLDFTRIGRFHGN